MSKQCAQKIVTPAGERYCKLPAQEDSIYCHQHAVPTAETAASSTPRKPDPPDDSSAPRSLDQPAPSPGTTPASVAPTTGCVRDIISLVADTDLWETIIDTLSPRFMHLHDTDEMAYKDLYVTEALRCAVVPSEACPLRHEPTRTMLSSNRVAEMHETVVASLPAGLAGRTNVRPDAGFAASSAFQPGQPAYAALKANYPAIRQYVYTDEDWITFDDALTIIHNSSHLI